MSDNGGLRVVVLYIFHDFLDGRVLSGVAEALGRLELEHRNADVGAVGIGLRHRPRLEAVFCPVLLAQLHVRREVVVLVERRAVLARVHDKYSADGHGGGVCIERGNIVVLKGRSGTGP